LSLRACYACIAFFVNNYVVPLPTHLNLYPYPYLLLHQEIVIPSLGLCAYRWLVDIPDFVRFPHSGLPPSSPPSVAYASYLRDRRITNIHIAALCARYSFRLTSTATA
jgi:hypothetical protein